MPGDELIKRQKSLVSNGGFKVLENQTPWQEIFREKVEQFSDGMTLKGAPDYRDITNKTVPRNNH